MKPLILVSHGNLFVELKKSVEMIMGPQDDIYAVPLLPNEGPEEYLAKVKETVADLADYTVLADLYGGTPCNVMFKQLVAGKADFELYAGMNMAMVIEYLNSGLLGTTPNLIDGGRKGIQCVNDMLNQGDDDDDE